MKQEWWFINYDTGEELCVIAESFEEAGTLMFYKGDEYDLDPSDWELDRTEQIDPE